MRRRPKTVSAIIACLTVSIGCYQSFVLLYFAIGIGCALLNLWQIDVRHSHKESAWSQLAPFALFSVACSLISVLIGKVIQKLTGIPRSPYLDSFLNKENLSITMWPQNLLSVGKEVLKYFGGGEVYGGWFISLLVLTLAACFILTTSKSQPPWTRPARDVFLLFIALVSSPFFFSLIGGTLPTRSLLSMPYIAWIIGIIVITKIQQYQSSFLVNAALVILLAATMIQSLFINGTYNAASFLVDRHDSLLAASIYNRLNSLDTNSNSTEPIFLGIKGQINYVSPFPVGSGSTMGASFFDWDGGNPNRMIAYMNMLGYRRVRVLDNLIVRSRSEQIKTMKAWPSPGSLTKISANEYLLKLSDN